MQKLVFRNPNGEEIDFTSGDFGVTRWEGFSHVDMDVQSQQVPFNDGSVFLDALLAERELSITVAVNDGGDLEKRYRLKRELIHCLNPKLGEGELIYTNDYTSKKIVCVPAIPEFENKNINDRGTLKASCSFTASSPYWEDVEETVVPFSLYDNINMNNKGDVPCSLSVELYGDGLLNPTLRNITTQKEVSLSGNYTGAISYNFQYGKKEIKFGALTQEVNLLSNYSLGYPPSIAEGNGVIVISGLTSYFSHDGYNYYVIHNLAGAGSYDVSLASVYYSPQHSCFFATKETDGGIYKSKDGDLWENISNEIVGHIISIGETLIGFTLDSPEIKKSVDGGVTWTVAYTGTENITSISASENLIIAVTASNLYSSTDFGDTWTQSAVPGTYGGKIIWNSESEAFFLTGGGTFKSSDGTSWTQVMNDNIIALIFKPSDEKLYAILRQYDVYKLYSSSDMGDSWELVGNSFSANIVSWSNYAGRAICILENELRLSFDLMNYEEKIFPSINDIAVAEDKKIILGDKYYYKDEGWHQIINIPSQSHSQRCCYGKGIFLIKYIINSVVRLLRSSDDCNTWSSITIPTGMGSQRIAYSERLSKFFCGQYSSTDGINWSKTTDANVYNIFAVDTPNGSWLYASKTSYGHYLKSTDGITWIDTNVTAHSDGGDVCYCAKQNLVYLIYYNDIYVNNPETNVYTKIDFYQNEGMLYLAWSDELNMFIGNGGTIEGGGISKNWSYISYDGINWEHISSSIVSKYAYVKFLKSFIGTKGTSVRFIGEENIINNLNENSDMDFNLKIGNNQFRWSATTGFGMGTITYKQKYLGV